MVAKFGHCGDSTLHYGEVGTQKFERFLAKENIHVSFKNDMKANAVVRQASLDMSAKFENMHNWTCQQGLRNKTSNGHVCKVSELIMDLHH